MTTIKTSDDELMALEISYVQLTNKFAEEGISPLASAAVMVKLALMLYKSSLNSEEFNLMVDSISNSRDLIKTFDDYVAAGRLN